MTNEKNNNTLVADDDPTAELEAVTFRQDDTGTREALESDENTYDFDKRAASDAKKISRLQYDIETLRAKWLGLESEIKAREDLTKTLNAEVEDLRDKLSRKEKSLRDRDRKIKSLKAEIRDREEQHRGTTARLEEQLDTARRALHEVPDPPSRDYDGLDESTLSNRLRQTEDYADTLRRKLQDILAALDESDRERGRLASTLAQSEDYVRALEAELEDSVEDHNRLAEELGATLAGHVAEVRSLRLELGEAQDTIVQSEELNAQLASDLVDARGFKEELERMLSETDEQSRERLDSLEAEVDSKNKRIAELEETLDSRSDAINVLLRELTRKSRQIESIEDIGDVLSDIDERISDQFDDIDAEPVPAQRSHDRVTRVLLGRVGDKLLRFPLFKDRLTIGRSDDNDIQLDAAFISRRHAVVTTDGESTRVIDWGSKNGVYVNSERVTEHFLTNGDIVTIGNAHFRYDERPKRDT